MTVTSTEPTTARAEWPEIGLRRLPEYARDQFLTVAESVRWREPNGSMPFSPGMSLQLVIGEFDIRPVVAVSHSGMWEAHDTTNKPGRFGDFTCTYTVLGVRTRRQRMFFLDGGCDVTPVLILTDQEA